MTAVGASGSAHRRVALVTGAGSGIGRACARALAMSGCDLVLAGRRADALEATRAQIASAVPEVRVEIRAADVGRPEECEAVVADAVDRLGGVDIVVTAAANFEPAHVLDLTADSWDACLDVVLRGSVLVAIAGARHMRDHGGGRIVLISSINGAESEPETAHYSAAKAGIISVAKSMAVDLATHDIAVNSVAPGWVDTAMVAEFLAEATEEDLRHVNPLARVGQPEEIGNVVAYLATEAPGFLTGTTIFVDGGQTTTAPVP